MRVGPQSDDIYGYRRLKQQLSIPIMATEMTEGGLYALAPWLVTEATDFLRGDVVIKGGITGMMKIAHLAEAFNMNCEVHDAYKALNNVATPHVVMAMRNCECLEVVVIHPPGEYDTDHLSYGLKEQIDIDWTSSERLSWSNCARTVTYFLSTVTDCASILL